MVEALEILKASRSIPGFLPVVVAMVDDGLVKARCFYTHYAFEICSLAFS